MVKYTADNTRLTADLTWLTADATGNAAPVLPTTQPPTVDDYLELITNYHRGKPKFSAMITAITETMVANQLFNFHLPVDFDLDHAIGVQLDKVGEWIGRTRFVGTPIPGVYFSFDIDLIGFDQGVWKGPYDVEDGITRLDDDTYRTLLRAKIAANHWNGEFGTIKDALNVIFPDGETRIVVEDNQDMSMTFGVVGNVPSALFIALLSQGYIPLKPEGVQAYYVITTVDGPLFALDVDSDDLRGFDQGAWGAPPEHFAP